MKSIQNFYQGAGRVCENAIWDDNDREFEPHCGALSWLREKHLTAVFTAGLKTCKRDALRKQ